MNLTEQKLASHESLELHEVLNLKTLGLAKAKLMQGLVFDQELRALMEKDVQQSLKAIEELQFIYKKAEFATTVPDFRPTPVTN